MATRFFTKGRGKGRKVIPVRSRQAAGKKSKAAAEKIPETAVAYGAIRVWMDSGPGSYGFGRTWTLKAHDAKIGKGYSFWLGQDAKVMHRAMGVDYDTYPQDVSRLAKSREWDKVMPFVVTDYLNSIMADGRVPDETSLRAGFSELQPWELAVE